MPKSPKISHPLSIHVPLSFEIDLLHATLEHSAHQIHIFQRRKKGEKICNKIKVGILRLRTRGGRGTGGGAGGGGGGGHRRGGRGGAPASASAAATCPRPPCSSSPTRCRGSRARDSSSSFQRRPFLIKKEQIFARKSVSTK